MFGKLMNNYYYGKSGKGDYQRDDLPRNRWQLFWEMLRIRLAGLFRLNLMTALIFVPLMYVLMVMVNTLFAHLVGISEALSNPEMTEAAKALVQDSPQQIYSILFSGLVMAIPAIAITGPVQAGMAYVTRNWARDEHAFVWSDFLDALKGKFGQAIAPVTHLAQVQAAHRYAVRAAATGDHQQRLAFQRNQEKGGRVIVLQLDVVNAHTAPALFAIRVERRALDHALAADADEHRSGRILDGRQIERLRLGRGRPGSADPRRGRSFHAAHAPGLFQLRAQAAIFGLQHLDVRAHGRGKRIQVGNRGAVNVVRHGLSVGWQFQDAVTVISGGTSCIQVFPGLSGMTWPLASRKVKGDWRSGRTHLPG